MVLIVMRFILVVKWRTSFIRLSIVAIKGVAVVQAVHRSGGSINLSAVMGKLPNTCIQQRWLYPSIPDNLGPRILDTT